MQLLAKLHRKHKLAAVLDAVEMPSESLLLSLICAWCFIELPESLLESLQSWILTNSTKSTLFRTSMEFNFLAPALLFVSSQQSTPPPKKVAVDKILRCIY